MIKRASHSEMTVDSTENKKLGDKITFHFMDFTGSTDADISI